MWFPKSLVALLALACGASAGPCNPSSPVTSQPTTLKTSTTTTAATTSSTGRSPQHPCYQTTDEWPCGVPGTRQDPIMEPLLGSSGTNPTTLLDCALACKSTSFCYDFLWTPSAPPRSMCQRYAQGGRFIDTPGFPSNFYEMQCFNCKV